MNALINIVILLYILSTAGYVAFLFAQKEALHRYSYYLLCAGLLCHTIILGALVIRTGALPAQNLHQTLLTAGWTVALVFAVFQHRYNLKVLGVYAAPLVTFIVIMSSRFPETPARIKSIFSSAWLVFHVAAVFLGEAFFALACGVGVLYLLQERAIKSKRRGFFFKRLPSLEKLDTTGYVCIISGFTLLTVGLISGFWYAKAEWGRFWSWDPKEVWSAISWLLYAALLHERLAVGWRGKKSAVMAIIGFAFLLFTFLGVNFFLKGHHGEFTQL